MEGLSNQDLAHWDEFCQKNQIIKQDKTRTKRNSPKFKAGNQVKDTHDGGLSSNDLADWNDFCKNNDLPLNSLPTGMEKQEIAAIPSKKPKKLAAPVKPRQSPQQISTPGQHNIDRKILKRLHSGTLDPERTLDLHGMLKEEASNEVKKFVFGSYSAGKRLVLVIPGKGKDTYGRKGFGPLNQMIKSLLSTLPTSQYILHFQTAHQNHGGTGAYYIYLKRNRTQR